MEFISDNFISYDDELAVKQEKFPNHGLSLDPFSVSESISSHPTSISHSFKNITVGEDQTLTVNFSNYSISVRNNKKRLPFRIIKAKKEVPRSTSVEDLNVKVECDDKLVSRTKRILKREKAKQRIKIKLESNGSIPEGSVKAQYDVLENADLDPKTRKRVAQMIRNRISAQNSRDRKKAYMVQLEETQAKLYNENLKLNQEKEFLLKKLKKLQDTQKQLRAQNEGLSKSVGKDGKISLETDDNMQNINLSHIIESLAGANFGQIAGNRSMFNKCTMTLAMVLSVIIMLNMSKQGNMIPAEIQNFESEDLSFLQRKLFQEAGITSDLGEFDEVTSKTANILEQIKQLLANLKDGNGEIKNGIHNGLETGTIGSNLLNIIKIEEHDQDQPITDPKQLTMMLSKNFESLFEKDKDYHDHAQENIEMKTFNLDKTEALFEQDSFSAFQQNIGLVKSYEDMNQKDNELEPNLVSNWHETFQKNNREYN